MLRGRHRNKGVVKFADNFRRLDRYRVPMVLINCIVLVVGIFIFRFFVLSRWRHSWLKAIQT